MKLTFSSSSLQKILVTLLLFAASIAANATKHIVSVSDFTFTPSSFTANLGDTIEWDWVTGSHTTTSTTIPGGAASWDHALNSQDANNSFIYVPSVTGTYNYHCTFHFNTFGMIGSFTVQGCTPPTAQQAAITAGGPTTFCKGQNVVLTVAASGLTYQWKKGNTIQSGATNQSFTATKTGNYKCTVSNGCGSTTSNTIAVTQNPTPTVSVTQSPCNNGAVLLTCNSTPSTGVTFKWKKGSMTIAGATNSTYSATSGGTYKCTVTITATGCTKASAGSSVTISCKMGDVADGKSDVVVYPNPSSDYFTVNTAQLNPQSVIYIYDLTGRLAEVYNVNGDEMKVGASLSNGVYFLKVASDNHVQQVVKLVKNF